jgi:hypothetical protein
MGHQTQVKELLKQQGDKWRCDACGGYDWTIIYFLKSKLCFLCWLKIEEVMKEGETDAL